jgi:hypothetical protein
MSEERIMLNYPWLHSICDQCWDKLCDYPPVKEKEPKQYRCCWCGELHTSGIFIHREPKNTPCKGKHNEAEASI